MTAGRRPTSGACHVGSIQPRVLRSAQLGAPRRVTSTAGKRGRDHGSLAAFSPRHPHRHGRAGGLGEHHVDVALRRTGMALRVPESAAVRAGRTDQGDVRRRRPPRWSRTGATSGSPAMSAALGRSGVRCRRSDHTRIGRRRCPTGSPGTPTPLPRGKMYPVMSSARPSTNRYGVCMCVITHVGRGKSGWGSPWGRGNSADR